MPKKLIMDCQTGEEIILEMSEQEVAEMEALVAQQIASIPYTQRRAEEYPSIYEYIDGLVKGDQAQIDKYIQDCLAVKAKYPKPE